MLHTRRAIAAVAISASCALALGTVSATASPDEVASEAVAPQSGPVLPDAAPRTPTKAPVGSAKAPGRVSASAVPADAATISNLNIKDGRLYTGDLNLVRGSSTLTLKPGYVLDDDDLWDVYAEIKVNGKPYDGIFILVPTDNEFGYDPGIVLPGSVGPGTIQIVRTHVWVMNEAGTEKAQITSDASDTFKFRRDTFGYLKIKRVGKKVTFVSKAVVRKNNGDTQSAKKAKVQYKKSGGWKLLKNISLNSKGKNTFSISTSTKRKYRLYVPQTSVIHGMKIALKNKI